MINGDDISNELKTSMSLAGVSKFIVQNKLVDMNKNNNNYDNNNGNLNDLFVTWKEDNFDNNSKMKTPSKNRTCAILYDEFFIITICINLILPNIFFELL